jgi:hypothetical protein
MFDSDVTPLVILVVQFARYLVRLVGLEPTRPKAQGLNLVSIPISLQAHNYFTTYVSSILRKHRVMDYFVCIPLRTNHSHCFSTLEGWRSEFLVKEARFELTVEQLVPTLPELPQLPSQVLSLPAFPFSLLFYTIVVACWSRR